MFAWHFEWKMENQLNVFLYKKLQFVPTTISSYGRKIRTNFLKKKKTRYRYEVFYLTDGILNEHTSQNWNFQNFEICPFLFRTFSDFFLIFDPKLNFFDFFAQKWSIRLFRHFDPNLNIFNFFVQKWSFPTFSSFLTQNSTFSTFLCKNDLF